MGVFTSINFAQENNDENPDMISRGCAAMRRLGLELSYKKSLRLATKKAPLT